jgi:hypothetical protein
VSTEQEISGAEDLARFEGWLQFQSDSLNHELDEVYDKGWMDAHRYFETSPVESKIAYAEQHQRADMAEEREKTLREAILKLTYDISVSRELIYQTDIMQRLIGIVVDA